MPELWREVFRTDEILRGVRKGDGIMRIAGALCIPFLAASLAFGAIDGTVTNGTSQSAAAERQAELVKPGQGGMHTLGATTADPQGHFRFEKDEPGGGPQLIQVVLSRRHVHHAADPEYRRPRE